jgi:hypothetical protein
MQWSGMGPFVQLVGSEHGTGVFDEVARARRWDEYVQEMKQVWDEQERCEMAPPAEEQSEFDEWHAQQGGS